MEIAGYKARANVKAAMAFEKLAGKPMSELNSTITDTILWFRAMVIAAEGKEPKDLKLKLENMSFEQLTEVAKMASPFQGQDQQAKG